MAIRDCAELLGESWVAVGDQIAFIKQETGHSVGRVPSDLAQHAPVDTLGFRRQAAAPRAGEPELLRPESIAVDPVLLAEEIDDRRLLSVEPVGKR
ncbi:MAG: hypothetical protein P8J87_01000 [Verrucomicrobiales bacterium]|nr:hypothetical protein [Verrucomicrobiales bacterium]